MLLICIKRIYNIYNKVVSVYYPHFIDGNSEVEKLTVAGQVAEPGLERGVWCSSHCTKLLPQMPRAAGCWHSFQTPVKVTLQQLGLLFEIVLFVLYPSSIGKGKYDSSTWLKKTGSLT